jgi:C-terminal processing protease CtpA/Prc
VASGEGVARPQITAQEVVHGVIAATEQYWLDDAARATVVSKLKEPATRKAYDAIVGPEALCARITSDVQAWSNDPHFAVFYSPTPVRQHDRDEATPAEKAEEQQRAEGDNYGFARVERLDGNVGYLDLRYFADSDGSATASAAMALLGHTDALIVDLRQNGGGGDSGVATVLLSHLLPGAATKLSDLHWKPDGSVRSFSTLPSVPGGKYVGPVYVLMSKDTFSAAEGFSYTLQTRKRAVLVGEKTTGGVHPVKYRPLGTHVGVLIPAGRYVDALTGTDWTGGVKPDVAVPAAQALTRAHMLALEKLIAQDTATPLTAERKDALRKLQTVK